MTAHVKFNWAEASRSPAVFYRRGDTVLGNYTLTEGEAVILPIYPRASAHGRPVTRWEASLVTRKNKPALGTVPLFKALQFLQNHVATERIGGQIFIEPLSYDTLLELWRTCRTGETDGFEDEMDAIQRDMFSACYAYSACSADRIYVYCAFEKGMVACDYFFNINGRIVAKNHVNGLFGSDISQQMECMQQLIDDWMTLIKVFRRYDQKVPSEMKMIYDTDSRKIDTELGYGEHSEADLHIVSQKWLAEEKEREEQPEENCSVLAAR